MAVTPENLDLKADDRETGRALNLPPSSQHAEEAVIGAVLKGGDRALVAVADRLRAEHFYQRRNQLVYAAMLALFRNGTPINYTTLDDQLERTETYEPAGGLEYLSAIDTATPSAAHIEHYAGIVERTYTQRQLIVVAQDLAEHAYRDAEDPDEIVARTEAKLLECRAQGFGVKYDWTPEEWTSAVLDSIGNRKGGDLAGRGTGLKSLDRMTVGLQGGKVYVVCARTSVGKSVLALQIAGHVAEQYGTVLYASMEMKPEELGERLLVSASGLDAEQLSTGSLDAAQSRKAIEVLERFSTGGLYFRYGGTFDVPSIRASAMRRKTETGRVELIVVDYVQQLQDVDGDGRNRERNVALASGRLKSLSVELDVPIVAVAQLNRDPEKRLDKRPMLSDLRESGAIEMDADMVVALYREEMYDPNTNNAGLMQLIMLKNRAGVGMAAGKFRQVIWRPDRRCYGDWAKDDR